MSWHKALPRLMLYEVIAVDLSFDKSAESERDSSWHASLIAVWQLSWIRHVWLGNIEHIWEPPNLGHYVLCCAWCGLLSSGGLQLSLDLMSPAPSQKILQGSHLYVFLYHNLANHSVLEEIKQLPFYFIRAKAKDIFEKGAIDYTEIIVCCIFALWCDVFYWNKLPNYPSSYLLKTLHAVFLTLHENALQCLQRCLLGLTIPRRAASLCSDAWPLQLGPWLALQPRSRQRAKEGKGWRWERREEEARGQNTKFHLFWVGWLIF